VLPPAKGAPREDIFNAIRVVHAGGSLLQPLVASRLLQQVRQEPDTPAPPRFTPREQAGHKRRHHDRHLHPHRIVTLCQASLQPSETLPPLRGAAGLGVWSPWFAEPGRVVSWARRRS